MFQKLWSKETAQEVVKQVYPKVLSEKEKLEQEISDRILSQIDSLTKIETTNCVPDAYHVYLDMGRIFISHHNFSTPDKATTYAYIDGIKLVCSNFIFYKVNSIFKERRDREELKRLQNIADKLEGIPS